MPKLTQIKIALQKKTLDWIDGKCSACGLKRSAWIRHWLEDQHEGDFFYGRWTQENGCAIPLDRDTIKTCMDYARLEGIQVDHWMANAVKSAIQSRKLAESLKDGSYDIERGKNWFGLVRPDPGLMGRETVEVHTTDANNPVMEASDDG